MNLLFSYLVIGFIVALCIFDYKEALVALNDKLNKGWLCFAKQLFGFFGGVVLVSIAWPAILILLL